MTDRFTITVWHGEAATVFYVVDGDALEDEQPAVVESFPSRRQAESCRDNLSQKEAGHGPPH